MIQDTCFSCVGFHELDFDGSTQVSPSRNARAFFMYLHELLRRKYFLVRFVGLCLPIPVLFGEHRDLSWLSRLQTSESVSRAVRVFIRIGLK